MPDINCSFHATPAEIAKWVRSWSEMDGVSLGEFSFPPCRIKSIVPSDVDQKVESPNPPDFVFTVAPIKGVYVTQGEFHDEHPEALHLQVGPLLDRGLIESRLACRTDDKSAFDQWKILVADLKRATKAGLTIIDPVTGLSKYWKRHRYSQGAENLERRGVPMLSFLCRSPSQPIQETWRLGHVDG